MWPQIQETATISPNTIDYGRVQGAQQKEWTVKNLGIELEEETSFANADFEKALRSVSRKIKK